MGHRWRWASTSTLSNIFVEGYWEKPNCRSPWLWQGKVIGADGVRISRLLIPWTPAGLSNHPSYCHHFLSRLRGCGPQTGGRGWRWKVEVGDGGPRAAKGRWGEGSGRWQPEMKCLLLWGFILYCITTDSMRNHGHTCPRRLFPYYCQHCFF